MLEKTTRINYLLDFYQSLLTPKQRNYMDLYYLEDYSLGEISENFNVSRQAVYDNIKRTEAMLEEYENKLNLYGKFDKRQKVFQQMGETSRGTENDRNIQKWLQQLQDLE